MNKKELYEKKELNRRFKHYPEFSIVNFAAVASFLMLIPVYLSTNAFIKNLAPVYLLATIVTFIAAVLVRRNITKTNTISSITRKLGLILIPFIVTGNVFASIAGFTLIASEKTIEYTLAFYSLLISVFVILVSLLNLFKDYVSNTFLLGIYILLAVTVFYIFTIFMLSKYTIANGKYIKLKPLAYLLIGTAITGNLFALTLGLIILNRIKNISKNKTAEWIDIFRRLFRNYMSVLGLFVITFLLSLSICSYFTFDYSIAIDNNYSAILQVPSLMYPFGTDDYGRCVFTRIVFGARISLVIGIISTIMPILFGGLLGAISGHYGNFLDNTIMRTLDILYAVPSILLAIAIIAAFGANTFNLIMALSIGSIPIYARTMRAQVLTITGNEFVEAARACGLREYQIILKHIIPNAIAPIIVRATLSIGGAVLATSSLSYLGLGVEPHIPEWGSILKIGSPYLETNPYLAIYPGIAIVLIVLSFNYFGDGLRDALDPKLK